MAENQNNSQTNERLASLEAKLEFLKELLQEIRDDLKTQPTRAELDDLTERLGKAEDKISELEKSNTALVVKMSLLSAGLGAAISVAIKLLS